MLSYFSELIFNIRATTRAMMNTFKNTKTKLKIYIADKSINNIKFTWTFFCGCRLLFDLLLDNHHTYMAWKMCMNNFLLRFFCFVILCGSRTAKRSWKIVLRFIICSLYHQPNKSSQNKNSWYRWTCECEVLISCNFHIYYTVWRT